MTIYRFYRPLDSLTHFFSHIFYHHLIDLNEIYRLVYNPEWVYMFLMNKSFLQSLYTLQYMIFYPLCRPLDPLPHFFSYIFYHHLIDLNEIYRLGYKSEWVYMFLITKSAKLSLYNIEKRRVSKSSRVQCEMHEIVWFR